MPCRHSHTNISISDDIVLIFDSLNALQRFVNKGLKALQKYFVQTKVC